MATVDVSIHAYTFTGLTIATIYRLEVLAVNHQGTAPNNRAARVTVTTASGGNIICTLAPNKTLMSSCPCFTWTTSSTTPFSAQPPSPATGTPQVLRHLPGVEGSRALCRRHHWCADPLPDRWCLTKHPTAGQWNQSLLCLWHQEQCGKETQHQPAG